MRKLEKFEKQVLSNEQMSGVQGGLYDTTRQLCTSETCEDGCSDIRSTSTRDTDDGTVISTSTDTWTDGTDCP